MAKYVAFQGLVFEVLIFVYLLKCLLGASPREKQSVTIKLLVKNKNINLYESIWNYYSFISKENGQQISYEYKYK